MLRVQYFVQHPEREYKIGCTVETHVIRRADTKVDSVRQILTFCPLPCSLNHLSLHVKGEDSPRGPNKIGKCDTEVTKAAPDIHSSVARGNEFAQDRFGSMNESSKWIVKGVAKPPGARMGAKAEKLFQESVGPRFVSVPLVHALQ